MNHHRLPHDAAYQCEHDECRDPFRQKFRFTRHMEVHHSHLWTCVVCGAEFQRYGTYQIHIRDLAHQHKRADQLCKEALERYTNINRGRTYTRPEWMTGESTRRAGAHIIHMPFPGAGSGPPPPSASTNAPSQANPFALRPTQPLGPPARTALANTSALLRPADPRRSTAASYSLAHPHRPQVRPRTSTERNPRGLTSNAAIRPTNARQATPPAELTRRMLSLPQDTGFDFPFSDDLAAATQLKIMALSEREERNRNGSENEDEDFDEDMDSEGENEPDKNNDFEEEQDTLDAPTSFYDTYPSVSLPTTTILTNRPFARPELPFTDNWNQLNALRRTGLLFTASRAPREETTTEAVRDARPRGDSVVIREREDSREEIARPRAFTTTIIGAGNHPPGLEHLDYWRQEYRERQAQRNSAQVDVPQTPIAQMYPGQLIPTTASSQVNHDVPPRALTKAQQEAQDEENWRMLNHQQIMSSTNSIMHARFSATLTDANTIEEDKPMEDDEDMDEEEESDAD